MRDSFCEDYVADRYPDLDMPLTRAFDRLGGSWDLMYALGQASIVRAAWSRRQLFEVMVDFWSNHLNVTNPHEACWWSRHDYDRRVIREHALGTFRHMLRASATHPAMMTYLNNAESSRDNPNENYGREILELHSVGVDGGYDEDDMRQSTMILTGFGISWETGEFEYHPWDHYVGRVDVMGFHRANASEAKGKAVGLDYVDYLATHPATAERLARKLCHAVRLRPSARVARRHPGRDLPRPRHRDRARARAALRLEGVPVVGGSQGAPPVRGRRGDAPHPGHPSRPRRRRRPAGAVLDDRRAWAICRWAGRRPDGYPDTGDPWRSAGLTLGRWNMHVGLAAGWWPANHLKVRNLRKNAAAEAAARHPRRARRRAGEATRLPHAAAGAPRRGRWRSSASRRPRRSTTDDAAVDWRLPYLVALILDTPSHGIR